MIVEGPGHLLRMARSQFAHSWFDYEFMVTACLTGFQALEAAFRVLYPEAEKMPFRRLIRRAHAEGILPGNIADLADAGAELRNSFSHPLTQFALTLGAAAPMLENTHRLVALVMNAAAERDATWRALHAQHVDSATSAEQHGINDAAKAKAATAERTIEPLTREHLDRLAQLADGDHETFTRPAGHPEYRHRRVLVVLAQGAAQHYLDCLTGQDPRLRAGVKDLDIWTFYAAIPSKPFPAARRDTHADFGPSSLGRQIYDLSAARTSRERALLRRWAAYQGRRVDFLMRTLPVEPDISYAEAAQAVQDWLRHGAAATQPRKPSAWHLAQKAMATLTPSSQRGQMLWPADASHQDETPTRT
jgi:hypothetical protein